MADPPVPNTDDWVVQDFTDRISDYRNCYAKEKIQLVILASTPHLAKEVKNHICTLPTVEKIFRKLASYDEALWSKGGFSLRFHASYHSDPVLKGFGVTGRTLCRMSFSMTVVSNLWLVDSVL